MASHRNSSLARYRPAVIVIFAVVAGIAAYSIYTIDRSARAQHPKPTNALHRSNALRRRRTRTISNAHETATNEIYGSAEIFPTSVVDSAPHRWIYGQHRLSSSNGAWLVPLAPGSIPEAVEIQSVCEVSRQEAMQIRLDLESKMYDAFFAREMPSGPPLPLSPQARETLVYEFTMLGCAAMGYTEAAIRRYEQGLLDEHPLRSRETVEESTSRPSVSWSPADLSSVFEVLREIAESTDLERETVADEESSMPENDKQSQDDQNMLNLLYRIAENKARKEGVVHRGTNCNSCNVTPIRGIRYRCSNCQDWDLCEECEAHPRPEAPPHPLTHIFYKIKVPAPFLSSPRQPSPVWYPGRPGTHLAVLPKELKTQFCSQTGLQEEQVEAHWEQFQFLATRVHANNDSDGVKHAIDRRAFDKCFVPTTKIRPPPPNLVYDCIFKFYDTNNDGSIDFCEFLHGIVCIAKNDNERRKRIFNAYDLNGDGYVDRKDFLRIFRAYYALTKELTNEVVTGLDDDFLTEENARDVIASSQPISSFFSDPIPQGEFSQTDGKLHMPNGNTIVTDDQGITQDEDTDPGSGLKLADQNKIVADEAELAVYRTLPSNWYPGIPDLTLQVDDDVWPQHYVKTDDVKEALGRHASPVDIKDPVERSLILCASQERAEQEKWNREALRRRAVMDRWQARQFYLDSESRDMPPWESSSASSPTADDPENDLTSLRIVFLNTIQGTESESSYREEIESHVKRLDPGFPTPSEVPDLLFNLVRNRKKWHQMAESIAPRRDRIPNATVIVHSFLNTLHVREFLRPRKTDRPSGFARHSPTSRQSRSSSKVKFENEADHDGDHDRWSATSVSSRSIPVGERWGGYEIPEPEEDHSREVIYQVTQESMNQLLDPMFKLREYLALNVLSSVEQRSRHKAEVTRYLECHGYILKFIFSYYQKSWYQATRSSAASETQNLFRKMVKGIAFWVRQNEKKSQDQKIERREAPLNEGGHDSCSYNEQLAQNLKGLSQFVANDVAVEDSLAFNGGTTSKTDNRSAEASGTSTPENRAIVTELEQTITNFNTTRTSLTQTAMRTPLGQHLTGSDYGVVTPPISSPTHASRPATPAVRSTTDQSSRDSEQSDIPDPTMPQNRPNSAAGILDEKAIDPPSANLQPNVPSSIPAEWASELPTKRELQIIELALLETVEQDDAKRGGPGRLNYSEFEQIMTGDKGKGLGFVGSWIDSASF